MSSWQSDSLLSCAKNCKLYNVKTIYQFTFSYQNADDQLGKTFSGIFNTLLACYCFLGQKYFKFK